MSIRGLAGDIYVVPREFAEAWWESFCGTGFRFEVVPPIHKEVQTEYNGSQYRRGRFYRDDVVVELLTMPGQHPRSGGALVGKHLVLLRACSQRCEETDLLLADIARVIVREGGIHINDFLATIDSRRGRGGTDGP